MYVDDDERISGVKEFPAVATKDTACVQFIYMMGKGYKSWRKEDMPCWGVVCLLIRVVEPVIVLFWPLHSSTSYCRYNYGPRYNTSLTKSDHVNPHKRNMSHTH